MKEYLEQLASIKRTLQYLILTRQDIDETLLSVKERRILQDCDDAVDTLLDVIYYCEE